MSTDKYSCEDCIWEDSCAGDYPCADFSPINEDIDDFIESERQLFRSDWAEYITDFQ